ncbi:UPF0481 protein [Zea mays]|uniref:UPF0481 protein n=1 Tax=Zea mays TaxID=4577 RepID=A0A1D6QPC7_MAIZE|nr:UPF0481 protein [Zea mays]
MATETESFYSAQSSPEPEVAPMAPNVEPASQPAKPAAPQPVEPASQPAEPAARPADRLEILIERGLGQRREGESSMMTIFRVPAHVRDASKELYEPRLVSIGPYYRDRAALRTMEQHKWRYMRELMRRPHSLPPLDSYVRAVRNVEQEARCCYSERTDIFGSTAQSEPSGGGEIEEAHSPGFAEMLMLDGCFILEFFLKWHKSEKDKLCDVAWGLTLLHSDLLLLENQIPFFVLEALLHVVGAWFSKLLSLIRSTSADSTPTLVVPSVTQLREAGVRFEKKESPRHMFDIAFDRNTGVLEMPQMELDYANKALLVNLVAFEQTRDLPGAAKRLSSYVALVGALVRTGKDVEHLQKHDIIQNLLDGDDEAATNFFQHLGDCSSLDYKNHMFADMFKELRDFYDSSWQRHRAKFLRDHCSSPWAIFVEFISSSKLQYEM